MKKIFSRLYLILALTAATALQTAAQENQTYITHTIEKGQSLYSISHMYGVTIDDIVRLNPGSDKVIVNGRTLKIPVKSQTQQGTATASGTQSEASGTFHTIVAGETLYRLTQQYHVTAKALCDANPGLSAQNFRAGQVIFIPASDGGTQTTAAQSATQQTTQQTQSSIRPAVQPACRDMHKVKRKETVYSIARQYGITEQELVAANPEIKDMNKLKRGSFLCIPYTKTETQTAVTTPQQAPTNEELFSESRSAAKDIKVVKAAVILPFTSSQPGSSERDRMVEYYQGLLLAVDSLKRQGVSMDIYAYDSGTTEASVQQVLSKSEMRNMDVIFGPLHAAQVKPMAEFARQNNIRLVIPFTSRDNTVYRNPQIYQVNTPQSYLYSEVYDHFLRQFSNANVIFIEASKGVDSKADFIKGLREKLSANAIPMTTVKETATAEQYKATLKSGVPNVFIPTSGSDDVLIKAVPQLTIMANDSLFSHEVHLFGYPEWQTYTKDYLTQFFKLDTYFYTSFYTNNLLAAPKQFAVKFRQWYGKDMADRYPKYGMLGFDTGYFFLNGLSRYGSALEDNVGRLNPVPMQTGFKFQRVNNWGGFVNKKVFFVRFSKNYEIVKMDFD